MYTVTVHHHDKNWRNGDLEDKFELIRQENFKTRIAAKQWILSQVRGKNRVYQEWHKGDKTSYAQYFTGVTWVHENTGEDMEEYYQYTLKKTKVN